MFLHILRCCLASPDLNFEGCVFFKKIINYQKQLELEKCRLVLTSLAEGDQFISVETERRSARASAGTGEKTVAGMCPRMSMFCAWWDRCHPLLKRQHIFNGRLKGQSPACSTKMLAEGLPLGLMALLSTILSSEECHVRLT